VKTASSLFEISIIQTYKVSCPTKGYEETVLPRQISGKDLIKILTHFQLMYRFRTRLDRLGRKSTAWPGVPFVPEGIIFSLGKW
jgi:hypothetical protein